MARDIGIDAAKTDAETEIAELAAIVIHMNVWTRLKLAQGAVPVYR